MSGKPNHARSRLGRTFRAATTTLLVLVLESCGSSAPKNDPAPAPSASAGDGGDASGAAVFLKSHLDGDRLVVDVIARGPTDVHGAAFRLYWDTTRLSFVDASASDAWSKQVLALAKEGAPGELAVAWTEKGSGATIDARQDTRLGTITFSSPAGAPAPPRDDAAPRFRVERSKLVDSKGVRLDVGWQSGDPAIR